MLSKIIAAKNFSVLSKNNQAFSVVVTLIFFCLGLFGILNHSMWRDELNVWLIAKDSSSLGELFGNIKYEGHPALWYLFLYLLNQFTNNPVVMQFLHLLIATGVIYIFLRFSPFTQSQKALFAFGYLPFYEYLVISRNYAIGLLLIFAFCALYPTRINSYFWLAVILLLLANSNAYCLFISLALGLTLIIEYSFDQNIRKSLLVSRRNMLCSLMIFVFGIISSLMQLIPPADSTLQGGLSQWMLRLDIKHLAKALTRIWDGYIIILVPSDRYLDLALFALLSLFFLAFVFTILIRKPIALFFYLFGTSEILAFTYVKFLGAPRHYGHFYVVLIISLWMASYYSDSNLLILPLTKLSSQFQKYLMTWMKFVTKHKTTFVMVILYSQLVGGVVAFSRDLLVPYSASREAARFIKNQHLEQMFIVASRDANVSPLAGYLSRKFYYPERQGIGSFVLFNSQRKDVDSTIVLDQVSQLIRQKNMSILLILNSELQASRSDIRLSFLSKFTNSLISNERYYLYLVTSTDKL